MSFLTDLLALDPAVLWPLGEAAGVVAEDATGNDRDGTYGGAPTLAQPSMVPNMPAATSVGFDGVNDEVRRAYEQWQLDGGVAMDSITAAFVYFPRSFAAEEDV